MGKTIREYKFTLEDVLLLMDKNREREDKIIISEQLEEETWSILSMNSKLLWVKDNLERKVSSINICDDMIQIWLVIQDI